jgi:hypothetical protein
LLSSSFYYWWWILHSDTYHVTKPDVADVPYVSKLLSDEDLGAMAKELLQDLWSNAERRMRERAGGEIQEEINFYVGRSRHILVHIDRRISELFGLSKEDAEFIDQFQAKFRFGAEE